MGINKHPIKWLLRIPIEVVKIPKAVDVTKISNPVILPMIVLSEKIITNMNRIVKIILDNIW